MNGQSSRVWKLFGPKPKKALELNSNELKTREKSTHIYPKKKTNPEKTIKIKANLYSVIKGNTKKGKNVSVKKASTYGKIACDASPIKYRKESMHLLCVFCEYLNAKNVTWRTGRL